MKKLCGIFLCLLTTTLWAAPSFTDLDSWQLPDPEPAKPAAAPKPVLKPAEPQGEEIKVEMAGGSNYTSAKSTQDPDEIHPLHLSAKQLAKKLAGKSRFYVLFNANISSTYDGIILGPDGTRYAWVRFGKQEGPYRQFLFEGGGNQPLLAVADDVTGVLGINARYGVTISVNENDFKKAYPNATLRIFRNDLENKEYPTYQTDGPFFLVFEKGQLVKQFATAKEFVIYMQSIGAVNKDADTHPIQVPAETQQGAQPAQQTPEQPSQPQQTPAQNTVPGNMTEADLGLPRVIKPKNLKRSSQSNFDSRRFDPRFSRMREVEDRYAVDP